VSETGPLDRLFEAMEDALCVIEILDPDADGVVRRVRYVHANRAFERHSGHPNVEGLTSDVAFPGLEQHWFDHFARVWRTGQPSRFTDEAPSLGRVYEVSLSRIGTVDARQVACLFRDVTLQHAAQQRALQMAAELSEADRRKTEFLATLAHELRNPLAPIRNGLDLVETIEGMPAGAARLHTMMSRQVGQLSRLVDDLLDLSRISQDKIELQRTPTSLAEIVDDAVAACRPMLEDKGHQLAVDVPPQNDQVEVDAVRLTQVLTNLLNNAVRYTPPNGHLEVWASVDKAGLHVAVGDDGDGMSEEELVRAFEMFTQIRGNAPREHGGLGIGLTLAQRIVELHGGRLKAKSPGRGLGSQFEVHVPHVAPSPPGTMPARGSLRSSEPAPPTRILIVDDNRDAADTLAKILTLDGHETRAVYSGRTAIEASDEMRPAVVFLDIGLPDITGYQVALELGSRDYRNALTLIALTGWGMDRDRERSHDAGFEHHLTKPVSAQIVLGLLADINAARATTV